MSLFKRKSSSASSLSSLSTLGSRSSQKNSFCNFDEKKDYVRRCNVKHASSERSTPCAISFCLGKKY
ncbi:hypothetical protein A9F13_17g00275 [Clavispora lusitaniae]|uniref:Uncharacterized protein n=1 Tax=Clavispora lusitaniae TaxID=36911 RepID=A0AA91PW83_CLALS|nr:hypothetical protein A9F13_17g00275 [Clavispora lusitaniae]